MQKLAIFVSAVLMLVLLSACELTNPSVTFSCTDIHVEAVNAFTTVDNTGWGAELVIVRAYDGYGNQLFSTEYKYTAFSAPLNETYHFTTAPLANPIRIEAFGPAGGNLAQDTVWYSTTGSCAGLPTVVASSPDSNDEPEIARPVFSDGRLNDWDAAAPFAIYREGDDLHFYWADGGFLALVVTQAEMTAGAEFPTENTLIAANEELGLYFYRLTDGQFQAQARMSNGKLYVIIFAEIYSGAHKSYESEQ